MGLPAKALKSVVGPTRYKSIRQFFRNQTKRIRISREIHRVHGKLWPSTAQLWNGSSIVVNPKDFRARKLLLRKRAPYYSRVPYLINLFSRNFNFKVFIDVGANYGECALAYEPRESSKLLAIEANPQLIPFLEKISA